MKYVKFAYIITIWEICIYHYFTSGKFFIPELAGGVSLESVWQLLSSGLQDSSEYSNQYPQYSGLDGLDSSADFLFLQSLFQTFGNCS